MDEHLQEVHDRAKQELTQMHFRWQLFRQLFATNPYRIDLINQTSANLLVQFQWLVIDYMILSLSKLTDPAEMWDNNNLSFHYILEKVHESGNDDLASEIEAELGELTAASEKFRNIRNKRVAHNDLVTALESEQSPLPGVSRAEIETALNHARNIMNQVELSYNNSQTAYEHMILPLQDDGRSVLIWLQKGLAYEQLADEGLIARDRWRELGDIDS